MVENKADGKRYRADHLIEEYTDIDPATLSFDEMTSIIKEKVKITKEDDWGMVSAFELMFKTSGSKTGDENSAIYLRPETAQGIFINFKNVIDTMNLKIPFALGQVGKSFRNEVTPGNFVFRTREFEQLELEAFVKEEDAKNTFNTYKQTIDLFLDRLGIMGNNLRIEDVSKDSLAHYSTQTFDYEFQFPFG
jgi:glycyl-tRNA synthetase